MKSAKEIKEMLLKELWNYKKSIGSLKLEAMYYNDHLGDTSFLLAGLLGELLKSRDDWDSTKWLDDSLLRKVHLNKSKLSIWGVMIWGTESTTEQWVDPFFFEVDLCNSLTHFTFMLGDVNKPEIPYKEFRMDRTYWNQDERDWRYIICQEEDKESEIAKQ